MRTTVISISLLGLLSSTLADYVPTFTPGLTDHFIDWLNSSSAYEPYDFNRSDLGNMGSFGGKESDDEILNHYPIIFFHGHADAALRYRPEDEENGWTFVIEDFLSRGYKKSELYATTWGFVDWNHMKGHAHSQEYILRFRKFIMAVLKYTGAEKVNVIGHSMGVTFSRKAIKGGWLTDYSGDGTMIYLGDPLTDRVDTYIGIAGVNYGLKSCQNETLNYYWTTTCNSQDGFFPGWGPDSEGMSEFLVDLNKDLAREGEHVFTISAKYD